MPREKAEEKKRKLGGMVPTEVVWLFVIYLFLPFLILVFGWLGGAGERNWRSGVGMNLEGLASSKGLHI